MLSQTLLKRKEQDESRGLLQGKKQKARNQIGPEQGSELKL